MIAISFLIYRFLFIGNWYINRYTLKPLIWESHRNSKFNGYGPVLPPPPSSLYQTIYILNNNYFFHQSTVGSPETHKSIGFIGGPMNIVYRQNSDFSRSNLARRNTKYEDSCIAKQLTTELHLCLWNFCMGGGSDKMMAIYQELSNCTQREKQIIVNVPGTSSQCVGSDWLGRAKEPMPGHVIL